MTLLLLHYILIYVDSSRHNFTFLLRSLQLVILTSWCCRRKTFPRCCRCAVLEFNYFKNIFLHGCGILCHILGFMGDKSMVQLMLINLLNRCLLSHIFVLIYPKCIFNLNQLAFNFSVFIVECTVFFLFLFSTLLHIGQFVPLSIGVSSWIRIIFSLVENSYRYSNPV